MKVRKNSTRYDFYKPKYWTFSNAEQMTNEYGIIPLIPKENPINSEIFVTGYKLDLKLHNFLKVFGMYGKIKDVYPLNPDKSPKRHFIFIKYENPKSAKLAILQRNGKKFYGLRLLVHQRLPPGEKFHKKRIKKVKNKRTSRPHKRKRIESHESSNRSKRKTNNRVFFFHPNEIENENFKESDGFDEDPRSNSPERRSREIQSIESEKERSSSEIEIVESMVSNGVMALSDLTKSIRESTLIKKRRNNQIFKTCSKSIMSGKCMSSLDYDKRELFISAVLTRIKKNEEKNISIFFDQSTNNSKELLFVSSQNKKRVF